MGISWSAMRKRLEQENICPALLGRVQYFATRYRKSHESEGRVAVRVDSQEVFRSDFFKWHNFIFTDGLCKESGEKSWHTIKMESNEYGAFDQFAFYDAFYKYDNQSIEQSLDSDDAIVRMFAIMDKRAGKRTLQKLLPSIDEQPDWLRFFYRLRMDSENIKPTLKKETNT